MQKVERVSTKVPLRNLKSLDRQSVFDRMRSKVTWLPGISWWFFFHLKCFWNWVSRQPVSFMIPDWSNSGSYNRFMTEVDHSLHHIRFQLTGIHRIVLWIFWCHLWSKYSSTTWSTFMKAITVTYSPRNWKKFDSFLEFVSFQTFFTKGFTLRRSLMKIGRDFRPF